MDVGGAAGRSSAGGGVSAAGLGGGTLGPGGSGFSSGGSLIEGGVGAGPDGHGVNGMGGEPFGGYGNCFWECVYSVTVLCPGKSVIVGSEIDYDGDSYVNGGGPGLPASIDDACDLAEQAVLGGAGGFGGYGGAALCEPYEDTISGGPRCNGTMEERAKQGECQIAEQCCLVVKESSCDDGP